MKVKFGKTLAWRGGTLMVTNTISGDIVLNTDVSITHEAACGVDMYDVRYWLVLCSEAIDNQPLKK
jgi:hypothetical protein